MLGRHKRHGNTEPQANQRRKENEDKLLQRATIPEHLISVKVHKYKTKEFHSVMFSNNLR